MTNIGSLYIRNTAASSSSTTIMAPSVTPPLEDAGKPDMSETKDAYYCQLDSTDYTFDETPYQQKPTVLPVPVYTSSPRPTSTCPKKKVKRWMLAALMVIVGLLIALTFILIGLGKAIGHHHQKQPTYTTTTIVVVPTTSL